MTGVLLIACRCDLGPQSLVSNTGGAEVSSLGVSEPPGCNFEAVTYQTLRSVELVLLNNKLLTG